MNAENLEILKLALSINNGEPVGLRSIDLRLMRSYPAVVQRGELLQRVRSLVQLGALTWKQENSSIMVTEQGKSFVLEAEGGMRSFA